MKILIKIQRVYLSFLYFVSRNILTRFLFLSLSLSLSFQAAFSERIIYEERLISRSCTRRKTREKGWGEGQRDDAGRTSRLFSRVRRVKPASIDPRWIISRPIPWPRVLRSEYSDHSPFPKLSSRSTETFQRNFSYAFLILSVTYEKKKNLESKI